MSAPDRAFAALADRSRRRILLELVAGDRRDAVRLRDAVDLGGSDGRARRLQLHHLHLPKLEERGYVDWDREASTVARGPDFDEIRPLLELLDEHREELPDGWL